MRIDRLKRNYPFEIKWTNCPLHLDIPEDGRFLDEIFGSDNLEKMMILYRAMADELRLPLCERERTYNSRLAQELGKWAELKGKGERFHKAVFHAFFAELKNIGKIEELVLIAKEVGLPENEARWVLKSRTFKEVVDCDWLRAEEMGVLRVPTFVIGHQRVTGAESYEVLEELLRKGGLQETQDQLCD